MPLIVIIFFIVIFYFVRLYGIIMAIEYKYVLCVLEMHL